MALTRTELKQKWIRLYQPTQSDYADLFDTVLIQSDPITAVGAHESFYNHSLLNGTNIDALFNVTGVNSGDQSISLTGDITGTGGNGTNEITVNTSFANKSVTLAKIQDVPTNTFLGRVSGSTGPLELLDLSQIVASSNNTINNKPVSSNPTLMASDVGAVPTSRLINGMPLTSDITIAASANALVVTSTRTSDFTINQNMGDEIIPCNGINVSVPLNYNQQIPVGYSVGILQMDDIAVTIVPLSGVTVNTPTTLTTQGKYTILLLTKIDTDSWIISSGTVGAQGLNGVAGATGAMGYIGATGPTGSLNTAARNSTGIILFGGGASGASATYIQSGNTVTVSASYGHGLVAGSPNYHNGRSILLTQGTVATGATSAGILTTEICTNFTYVSTTVFTCTSSIARYTSGTLGQPIGEIIIASVPISANTLRANGKLTIDAMWSNKYESGANNVQNSFKIRFGGNTVATSTIAWQSSNINANSLCTWCDNFKIFNRNSVSAQIFAPDTNIVNKSYAVPIVTTYDTTQPTYVNFIGQFGTTNPNYRDFIILENYDVVVYASQV